MTKKGGQLAQSSQQVVTSKQTMTLGKSKQLKLQNGTAQETMKSTPTGTLKPTGPTPPPSKQGTVSGKVVGMDSETQKKKLAKPTEQKKE
jgi:hypothetical protein